MLFCLALCFIVCLQCLHCTLWRGSLTTMSVRTPSTSRAETTPSPLSYSTRVTWSTLSPGLAALMVRICVWNVNRWQNYLMLCKWESIECWNWEIFIYLKICQFQMNQKHFKNGRTGHVYHFVASALLLTTTRCCRSKIKLFFHSRLILDVQ